MSGSMNRRDILKAIAVLPVAGMGEADQPRLQLVWRDCNFDGFIPWARLNRVKDVDHQRLRSAIYRILPGYGLLKRVECTRGDCGWTILVTQWNATPFIYTAANSTSNQTGWSDVYETMDNETSAYMRELMDVSHPTRNT